MAGYMSGMFARDFSVCTALKDLGVAGADGMSSQRAVYCHLEDGGSHLPSARFYSLGGGSPPQASRGLSGAQAYGGQTRGHRGEELLLVHHL